MDIREPRYIAAIAKYKNLSVAAEHLHITQPTLSSFLKKQELELGSSLFSRVGNKLIPTAVGECYIEAAQKMIDANLQLKAQLQSILREKDSYRLRIGITPTFGSVVLAQIFTTFQSNMPYCNLSLITRRTAASLEEMLLNGEIDFAFVLRRDTRPANHIERFEIWKREFLLIVPSLPVFTKLSKIEPGREYSHLDISLLENEPFLVYDDPLYVETAQSFFKKAGISPKIIHMASEQNLYTVLRCGYGVSLHTYEPNGLDFPTYSTVDPTPLQYYYPAHQPEYITYCAEWRGGESDKAAIRTAIDAISDTRRVFNSQGQNP